MRKDMKVHQIDQLSKKDVKKWVNFPLDLYKDHELWVPPFINNSKKELNRKKHSFYKSGGDAAFFVVEEDGKIIARVGVTNDKRTNREKKGTKAQFNWFEAYNDKEAVNLLFEAAFEWCREQGLTQIEGPKAILNSSSSGILVKGYEHRPAVNVAYNLDYYPELIESVGFVKDHDMLSGFVDITKVKRLPERVEKIAGLIKKRRGFHIKEFKTKKELWDVAVEIKDVFQAAFGIDGVSVMTDEQFLESARELIFLSDPKLMKLVMKDEKIIGFLFTYPDISKAIKRAKGRMLPFGIFHILLERKTTKWINVNGVGILPEYQGLGANAILYHELAKTLKESDYKFADVVFVSEYNYKSFSDNESMGVTWYKAHRIYKRELSI
jgi:hypothetical protein